MSKHSVLIIGAGIIGVTTAFQLTRKGFQVTLVDSASGPVLGSSEANAAQLSYSYTDAMASPELFAKIPGILLGLDPTFKIQLSMRPDFLRWCSCFLANALPGRELDNTRNVLRLALHSRNVLHNLLQENPVEFDWRASGKLHIFHSSDALQKASQRVKFKSQYGSEQVILDAKECLALEPALNTVSDTLAGGVYSPQDEVGDCARFARGLLSIMRQEGNLTEHYYCQVNSFILHRNKVTGVQTSLGNLSADNYVLATGAESPVLANKVGLKLPVYPIKGYSITVPATDAAPNVCITDVEQKFVICRLGDKLRVAGCADIVGHNRRPDPRRVEHLLAVVRSRFPDAGQYDLIQPWAGMRPATPSSSPIVGQAGPENLYLNTGHGMLGWTLSMGSAALLTAQMTGSPIPLDATGFTPRDHGLKSQNQTALKLTSPGRDYPEPDYKKTR